MYDLPIAKSIGFKVTEDELLRECRDAGICFVEIALGMLEPGFGTDADLANWDRKLSLLNQYGIRVLSVHLPFGPNWDISTPVPDRHEELLRKQCRLVEIFQKAAPRRFLLHPCYWPIPPEEDEARVASIRHAVTVLSALASPARIVLENLKIDRIAGSADELLHIAQELPGVGFCCDMNHFMRERAEHAIPKFGNRLWSVHVSDYDFVDERHWLPGEGKNNWNAILGALESIGYDGPFLYETSPNYPPALLAENKARLFQAYNAGRR